MTNITFEEDLEKYGLNYVQKNSLEKYLRKYCVGAYYMRMETNNVSKEAYILIVAPNIAHSFSGMRNN